MNILKIWDADYPWDIRVEKICDSLVQDGHTVHLVCRNLKKSKIEEVVNGIQIKRLPRIPTKILNYIFTFPFFLNPLWIFKTIGVIRKNKIDIILVRDLPLTPMAVIVGKLFRIPVVFDMAENYPAMLFNNWEVKRKNPINYFVRNPYLAGALEKKVCHLCHHIIVVIEESKERINNFLHSEKKISIVINTPSIKYINSKPKYEEKELFQMVYIGGLQKGRGVDKIIETIPEIIKTIPNFEFVICGAGYEYANLKKLSTDLNIEKSVNFRGWVDNKHIFKIISGCDVGIIPHTQTDHTNTTIPNKLFDYMIMGKPVIATNCRPIQRILNDENCGLTFNDDSFGALPGLLKKLTDNQFRGKLGLNGWKAVKNRYHWEVDSKVLGNIFIHSKDK